MVNGVYVFLFIFNTSGEKKKKKITQPKVNMN